MTDDDEHQVDALDDVVELDTADSQFHTLLSQLPAGTGSTQVSWVEDDYVPYTPYDRWRDVVAWRRAEFRRRLEPPVP